MKRRLNLLRAILVVVILVAIKLRLNRLVSLLYLQRNEDFIFPTEEKSFHFGKFKSGIDGIFESDQLTDEFSDLYIFGDHFLPLSI